MDGPVFPLDRILGLSRPGYTPRLSEAITRLGASVGFREATDLLRLLMRVDVSEESVRRLTQEAGRKLVAQQEKEGERIRRRLLRADGDGETLQQVSVDGAMVPLVGGEYAEVKTVAIGAIRKQEGNSKAEELSYFSRLADHQRFTEAAGVEFFRRKTENAREVVAVTDGAEWIQGFLDEHCPNALRIIDWTHAAGYIGQAGQALFGPGTQACGAWVEAQLGVLWTGKPETVIETLASERAQGGEAVRLAHQYLEKRKEQLRYAAFRAGGYPVGSGIVESANKAVVEARLKGRGRHWARKNVDPMLALRCAIANRRWSETWDALAPDLAHHYRPSPRAATTSLAVASDPVDEPPTLPALPPPLPAIPPKIVDGRPTDAHPWKRFPTVPRHRAKI